MLPQNPNFGCLNTFNEAVLIYVDESVKEAIEGGPLTEELMWEVCDGGKA